MVHYLCAMAAIGMAGIEPATFCSQSRRATAALHPVSIVKVRSLNHPFIIAYPPSQVKRENRTFAGGKPSSPAFSVNNNLPGLAFKPAKIIHVA